MGEMHKGIDCPKSVVGYLSLDLKGQVPKQSTRVAGKTALIQTNLLWVFFHLADLLKCLGKVSILMSPCCFEAATLPPHSKNLKGFLKYL